MSLMKKIFGHPADEADTRGKAIKERQEEVKKRDVQRRLELLQTELEVIQRRV